ncbi:MAG TPA: DUF2490 domain-containing protein [Prolixibacteraceae bacterium]|nr:DUF2490 domain-containing protein [Prolixibacteraceae bacterium]
MISTSKGILFLTALLLLPTFLNAQYTDLKARLGISVEKEISKKLSAGLEYEHRFDNMLTTFDKALVEPSVSYDLSKLFRIGLSYRFSYDQNIKRERRYEQRASLSLRFDPSFDDFKLKVKTTLQYGSDDLTNPVFNYSQKLISRNAIELEYDWFGLPLTPYVGFEFFYHINNPNGGIVNQTRVKAGIDYEWNRSSTFTAYYLFENEFNIAYPVDAHVFGIGYRYNF